MYASPIFPPYDGFKSPGVATLPTIVTLVP